MWLRWISVAVNLLVVFPAFPQTFGATYILSENIIGDAFYSHFDWEAVPDPNHGRVNYVDQATSVAQNLTYASSDSFILRTDYTSVLGIDGPGRNSVRIRSKNTYTTHVAIFDLRHMPQGCGTWPGVKEVKESDKPKGGLVDIVEGVNDQPPNSISLHTTEGCTMPAKRRQKGVSGQLDCNSLVNANEGCKVTDPALPDYGPQFNVMGGGWYVLERTEEHISVWFWTRHDPSVPFEIKHGFLEVDSTTWGPPVAYFPNDDCNPMSKYFEEHNIIINLTLCGDWAGGPAYEQAGCPSTCADFVNNNPAAFIEAYFDFAAVRVYI
ncbi:putative glycosidase C21B10.07 [Psilocybe cubensis]|uniref:Glycosidase C21B10.07 n=2 Tax=Psilocybe cubensis TaxID=181762 RepID=A0ACB8GIK2_PSICU|nr:putative glycosidase C21B10.07 [Psilocybe cubensis]KAH9475540.1 putative glycosidase C21B10.07 [Psilocybe cubensis]